MEAFLISYSRWYCAEFGARLFWTGTSWWVLSYSHQGRIQDFWKGWGWGVHLRSTSKTRGSKRGPILAPMLKSLYRVAKRGVRTPWTTAAPPPTVLGGEEVGHPPPPKKTLLLSSPSRLWYIRSGVDCSVVYTLFTKGIVRVCFFCLKIKPFQE